MRHGLATRRAFTLIELLMALAIGAMLMLAVFGSLTAVLDATRANDAQVRARQGATATLNLMLAKIRRAKEVTLLPVGAAANEYTQLVTLDSGDWDAAAGTYTNCQWSVFAISNGALQIGAGTTPDPTRTPVLGSVRKLVFRGTGGGAGFEAVTVEMSLDAADPFASKGAATFSVTGTAAVRSLRL